MVMARAYGLPVDHLARMIVAAFLFDVKSDPQSVELIDLFDQVGIGRAVAEYTGFEAGSDVHDKVVSAYKASRGTGKRYGAQMYGEQISSVIHNDVTAARYFPWKETSQ